MRDTLHTQIGSFASIPVWILDACKDANAIAVYAVLARHANRERRAWPGQDRIAGQLGASVSTVQRAMKLLRDVGAIATEARRQDGVIVGTSYVLLAKNPIKHYTSQVTGRTQQVAPGSAVDTTLHVTGDGGVTSQVTDKQDPLNKIQKEERDPVARAIDYWRAGWRQRYGFEATLIEKTIVIADVGRQLQAIGLDGWCKAVDGYFVSTDAFVLKLQHQLGYFAKDPNRWRAKVETQQATTAEGTRQDTRRANAAHVADGRLKGILARDNPEQFGDE